MTNPRASLIRCFLIMLIMFAGTGALVCLIIFAPAADDGLALQLTAFFNISRTRYDSKDPTSMTFDFVFPVTASADRSLWVSNGWRREFTIWDSSGHIVNSIDSGRKSHERGPDVRCLALTIDKQLLCTGHLDGSVKVWSVEQGTRLAELPPTRAGGVTCLAIAHDDSLLCVASANGSISVWDLKSLKRQALLEEHASPVIALACSPVAHRLASLSNDGRIVLWNLHDAEAISSMQGQPLERKGALAFSPDGKRLAFLGDSVIKTWGLARQKEEVLMLTPPETRYSSIAFIDNGAVLAAVGESRLRNHNDGIISLFDRQGAEIYWQASGGRMEWLVLAGPDKTGLITVNSSGDVKYWAFREELLPEKRRP